jgi:hypothetical protein
MDPKPNPPGYWNRETAQYLRETAARLLSLADELDAEGAQREQRSLADERVPDGSYGASR